MSSIVEEESTKSRIAVIREIGFFGYTTLITLNSGAFVVIFTFIGNIKEADAVSLNLWNVKIALWCFLTGIALTFLSATIAYLSAQLSLMGRQMPFASELRGHMAWLLLPVAFAFLAFLVGCGFAICGVTV